MNCNFHISHQRGLIWKKYNSTHGHSKKCFVLFYFDTVIILWLVNSQGDFSSIRQKVALNVKSGIKHNRVKPRRADVCVMLLYYHPQVEVCSPRIKQLLSLCCDAFSREQLCNLECLVLLRLNFRLAAPTLAFFLDYFISREFSRYAAGTEEKIPDEGNNHRSWKATEEQLFSVKRYKCLASKVCELSLADYAFNKYQPSVLVQSALNLSKDLLRRQLKESSVKHTSSSETLDFLCVVDNNSHGLDNHALIQQCTHELELLVSLNQESVQDLITLWSSANNPRCQIQDIFVYFCLWRRRPVTILTSCFMINFHTKMQMIVFSVDILDIDLWHSYVI